MNKAWSLFWLVVASVVAFVIIADLLKPYMVSIAIAVVIVLLSVTAAKMYRSSVGNRRHF